MMETVIQIHEWKSYGILYDVLQTVPMCGVCRPTLFDGFIQQNKLGLPYPKISICALIDSSQYFSGEKKQL